MNRTLGIGKSGLHAFQRKMDSIANNVANAQTMGYKKTENEFSELLRDKLGTSGTPLSEEMLELDASMGTGVKGDYVIRVFDQGPLVKSSRNLDVAIEGEGFFKVTDENNNSLLTRVGNFQINENGKFIDSNGYVVSVSNQKNLRDYDISTITINSEGSINAVDSKGRIKDVGRILLYDIKDKSELEDIGKGYLRSDDLMPLKNSISDSGFGSIRQGHNEMSNVDLGEEMVQMIIAQRAYQMNLKSIQSADEMMTMVNNIKR